MRRMTLSHYPERTVPSKRKIVAHEHLRTDRTCRPEPLVIHVPNSNRKPTALKTGLQAQNAEHLHRVTRYGRPAAALFQQAT